MYLDDFKPRYTLLPWGQAMKAVAFAAEDGAEKHGEHDYKGKTDPSFFVEKAFRHIDNYIAGQQVEPESYKHNLASAAMDLLIALHIDLTINHKAIDARDN